MSYGRICDNESYTITELKSTLGCKDPRTVVKWLEKHGIPRVEGPKAEDIVSGREINRKIQENGRCDDSDDGMGCPVPA